MQKELSIIIPAFNNYRLSASCLAHIFKSNYLKEKYEIIFVNNASTDNTNTLISYLVEQNEPINYIKSDVNLNYCKGLIRGWKEVKTPFFMLLNNDAFVDPNCIDEMLKIMKFDNRIGLVGAMEFLPNGVPTKTKPFMYFNEKTILDPILKGQDEVKVENGFVYVDTVGSACCMIRTEVSDKIGFFDETFVPCMFEQEDYWIRILLAGYRIALPINANFSHVVGATTAFDTNYYQQIIKINREKFLKKWNYLISDGKKLNFKKLRGDI